MSEDEIRGIVREEIVSWYEELCAAALARDDQAAAAFHQRRNERLAELADDPNDGPVVAGIKRILRGEEP